MSTLRRIVMLRHGETVGNSSVRFHGSADVALSEEGREHVRRAARGLGQEVFDVVVASSLRRAFQSAALVSNGAPVRLEADFREIDFGRWEGLTKQEIEASDPILYRDWQARAPGFEFPGGEPRKAFRERVLRGLERLERSGVTAALIVAHKGVIRTLAEDRLGEPLPDDEPPLGGLVAVSRVGDGRWVLGRRGSDPAGLGG